MAEQEKAQVPATAPSGLNSINTQAGGFMPSFRNFDEVWRWCDMVSRSNIVPKAYKQQPADIMVAVQFGAEIGLKWLQSLQSIAVVNGTPSIFGDAALALVRSSGLLEEFDEWLEVNGERQYKAIDVLALEQKGKEIIAYCRSKRKGMQARTTFFGVNDAKSIKLWLKRRYNNFETPWCTSPGRMLMWRARSWNLRDNFGDALKGLAFYEEAQDLDSFQPPTATEQIKEKSQPETKGKAVVESLKAVAEDRGVSASGSPYTVEAEAAVEVRSLDTKETHRDEQVNALTGETSSVGVNGLIGQSPNYDIVDDVKQTIDDAIKNAILGSERKLRETQAGTKALNSILSAMKVRLSHGKKPIDVIPAEQWEFYLDKLEKALG